MEADNEDEQPAASSKLSRGCSSSSSSSCAADDDAADPSLWLDMIQELFDLPPPSPTAASSQAPPPTSSLYFGGADKLATDHFGFRPQDQCLYADDESMQDPVSSKFGAAALLEAAPLEDHDRPLISGAAETELESLSGSNRSFSYADLRSPAQHHSAGAYSYPPAGYTRSSDGFAALVRPLGGGTAIQKVCSAPQLRYSGGSATFSGPALGESSSAMQQQPQLTDYRSHENVDAMLSFSPSRSNRAMHNQQAFTGADHHSFLCKSYNDAAGFGQHHAYNSQPPQMTSVQRRKQEVERGLGVVHILLACAEAVAKGDRASAIAFLIQLHPLVSKTGSSMQRVAAYFADALHARLTHTGGRSHTALLNPFYNPSPPEDLMEAYQVLYQACPYIKFAHFTSNQAIFEAFEGEGRVHIIDLDIVEGYQWPAFIQALAARPGGAPHLRITGVGTPLEAVRDTGKQLTELAEALHVPFEFHAVGERVENLKAHMLQRRVGEALAINAINCLHPLLSLPPSNKSLPNLLQMLLDQAPNIFTLVEQEASHNGPFFLSRFLEALHYYSAIFDSLDATLPQNSLDRAKVEMLVFAQEIVNIVACEDVERIKRHEKLDKWRLIMETMGFQSIAFSANAINQSRILLDLYPCGGYNLKESKGALQLGWQDRLIIGASTWH